MSEDTYMEHDPKTLEEARTMLLDTWEAIDKGQQAERRRDELIVQAFSLGASYMDVMSCTGLSRPTVWRIRRRAEKGIPSGEAGWDFTIPGHYSKTDVPQSILEDTLQDGLIGLLDDVADDDSQLGKDFSSPDLNDKQKAIRDAVHDLARRAAASKSDIVASTALGITLTRHKEKPGTAMKPALKMAQKPKERLRIADSIRGYQPVRQNLKFSYTTASPKPLSGETEGSLLYDPENRQYVGYFQIRETEGPALVRLPCTNGAEYDTTGQTRMESDPVDTRHGYCTVIGSAENH